MDFSFGDFEVPPLYVPALKSTDLAERQSIQEAGSLRSSTGSREWNDDETLQETPSQGPVFSRSASRCEEGRPSSDNLTPLTDHTEPTPEEDDSTQSIRSGNGPDAIPPRPKTDIIARNIFTSAIPLAQTQQIGSPRIVSVTLDGRNYLPVPIPMHQTSQEVRASIGSFLGIAPGTHISIFFATSAGMPHGEALTDERLQNEILLRHDHSDSARLCIFPANHNESYDEDETYGLEYQSGNARVHNEIMSFHGHSYMEHHTASTPRSLYANSATAPIGARNYYLPVSSPERQISSQTHPTPFTSQAQPNLRIPDPIPRRAQSIRQFGNRTLQTGSPPPMNPGEASVHISRDSSVRLPRRGSSQSRKVKIRDDSRARSTQPTYASGDLCDCCKICGHRRFHCNVCRRVYCDPCWELQFIHTDPPSDASAMPHEKTDPQTAKKIANVINSQLKEEQREKLHMDDINTTWFGVVREGQERPLFQDYGRYAALVADVKSSRLGTISDLSSPLEFGGETLYPSLVSFVGQTGAGKSSLIKLLIDLKSDEDEDFATPVVGAAGYDIATSEDVHLYLDPDSFESQAPLLFADCEGLEGGERDPVGARLKRKMASSQNVQPGGRRKPTSEREIVWADTPRKQSRNFAVAHLYPRLLYTFSDVIVFVLKNPRSVFGRPLQ